MTIIWNIIQFNFWADYHLDVDTRSIIQMSTMSATNSATNIVAVLFRLDWQKVIALRLREIFIRTLKEGYYILKIF